MIKINITIPLEFNDWEELRDQICDIIDWEDEDYDNFLASNSGFFNYLKDGRKDLISEDDIIDFLNNYSYLVLQDYDLEELLDDARTEVEKG